jgi:hypothetical protein
MLNILFETLNGKMDFWGLRWKIIEKLGLLGCCKTEDY